MKSLLPVAVGLLLLGSFVHRAQAAFSSLYVFGDVLTSTTNGPGGIYYYGNRYSNGRVWIEVLAQRQGLVFDSGRNKSYFGHYSPNLVTNVSNFVAPPDAATALFVVWVNNADFAYAMSNYAPYTTNNMAAWISAINRSLSNHLQAVQTLYAKGARNLIMPNAVDVTKIPYYVGLQSTYQSFVRERVIDFNTAFAAMLDRARTSFPGIAIHVPDVFALLNNLLAHPADYGLTNALYNGLSIDALSDPTLTDKSLTGPGANYIYWDYLDPTARSHAIIADFTHQVISPVRINSFSLVGGSNQLDMVNLPIGLDGVVEGGSNFVDWAIEAGIQSTNATQSASFPVSGPIKFFRLRFPFAWSWP